MSNKLFPALKQIGSKLTTGTREIMERVEIEVTSQRYHDTALVSIAIRLLRLLCFQKVGGWLILTDSSSE
jgi:hypothetical protein